MKYILGIILVVAGVVVFLQGLNRKDSLVGAAASVGTTVANTVDGGARQPKHVIYMVVGGVIAVVGVGIIARKS